MNAHIEHGTGKEVKELEWGFKNEDDLARKPYVGGGGDWIKSPLNYLWAS